MLKADLFTECICRLVGKGVHLFAGLMNTQKGAFLKVIIHCH